MQKSLLAWMLDAKWLGALRALVTTGVAYCSAVCVAVAVFFLFDAARLLNNTGKVKSVQSFIDGFEIFFWLFGFLALPGFLLVLVSSRSLPCRRFTMYALGGLTNGLLSPLWIFPLSLFGGGFIFLAGAVSGLTAGISFYFFERILCIIWPTRSVTELVE